MRKISILLAIMLLASMSFVVADVSSGKVSQSVNTQISLLNQDPDPAQQGRYVELRFRIENLGAYNSGDAVFELVPEYPFSMDPGQSAIREVGTLYGRTIGEDAATLYYKLRVDEDALDGDNYVRLRYTVDGGKIWALSDQFTIRIQNPYPIIGIESVTSSPEKIEPGKEAEIVITIKNLANSVMEDVTLKLDLSGDTIPLAPIDSTSEKKVGVLGAGKSKELKFKVIALGDAESKIYKVPITISYRDSTNQIYNKSDILALVIGATPDIVSSIDVQTSYSDGTVNKITLRFVNKGVTDVKFFNVEILESDDFEIISVPIVYVGDVDSDDYETVEFDIFVDKTRENSVMIPLRLEYTDPNNERFVQDISLDLNLYTGREIKKYGLNGGRGISWILILLILGGGSYFAYRKFGKKKKKK